MSHATTTAPDPARSDASPDETADGTAGWIVLFAAAMVTLLTLFAGTNLLGDRFDPAPAVVWSQPG